MLQKSTISFFLQWIPERKAYDISEAYSECEAQRREKMEAFFVDNANAMLFRNNAFSYGVLVKEKRDALSENTEKCVEFFKGIMKGEREQDWFLAVGQPVERLSSIKSSYYTASKTFARRYLYDGSVLYYNVI